MLGLLLGVGAGFLMPIQTTFNSRLRESVGSPFLSSLGSFGGGTLFLLFLTLTLEHSVLFPGSVFTHEPAWIWLGGLLGVIGLTGNIFLFPRLGGVQTIVIPIAGQILMGLVIDQFGLFGAHQSALTPARFLGAVLVLAGVLGAVILGGKKLTAQQPGQDETAPGLWGWRFFALITGFLMASQSAINGHLGQVLDSSIKAALVSFTVGTLLLFIIVLSLRLKFQVRVPAGKSKNPFWMWLGGPLGALYVFGNAFLVPVLGAGLTIVAVLMGMITGSLVVDKFGIFEARKVPVTLLQVLSLVVMAGGVVLIRLA